MNAYLPAKPKGDGSVQWKYLNPNLVAIALTSPHATRVDDSFVSIILLDAVTGEVVHSVRHRHASGPVFLTMAENWVAYHYWDAKAHASSIGVIQLNIDEPQWKSYDLLSFSLANVVCGNSPHAQGERAQRVQWFAASSSLAADICLRYASDRLERHSNFERHYP